eukprot:CAMPEP_0117426526 /NCGR_PEP_ID=MMETSP0758-20121206/6610_1 /TAXON_ID=63605 /ORGANISM="Percolomonas cosmopolitus, Strain AE-1 (ATCC 50343)" /LENGTH=873 /DNA_ID=CAMNT_0005211723 /DNA_START=86 /DNA_END=2704 /DNA_ORIENTATION=+
MKKAEKKKEGEKEKNGGDAVMSFAPPSKPNQKIKGPPKRFAERMAAYGAQKNGNKKPKFSYLKKGSRWDNVINKISKPGDPPPKATMKHTKKSVMERAIEEGTINLHEHNNEGSDKDYTSKLDNFEILVKENKPASVEEDETYNEPIQQSAYQHNRAPQPVHNNQPANHYPNQQQMTQHHYNQQHQQMNYQPMGQFHMPFNQPYFQNNMGYFPPTPNTTPLYQAAPNFMNHPRLQQHQHADPLQQPHYPASPTRMESPKEVKEIVSEDTYYTNPDNSVENVKKRIEEREKREAAQLEQDSHNFKVMESVGNTTNLNATIRKSKNHLSPSHNPFHPPNIEVNPFMDTIKLDQHPEVTPRSEDLEGHSVQKFKLFNDLEEDNDDFELDSNPSHQSFNSDEEEEASDQVLEESDDEDVYANSHPYEVEDIDFNDPLAMGQQKKKQHVRNKKKVKHAPQSRLVQNYFNKDEKKKLARKKAKIEKHRERKEKEAEQKAQMNALSSELDTYQKLSTELRRKMDSLGRDRQDFENEKLAWEKQKEKELEAIDKHRSREEAAIKKERRVLERQQHAKKIHMSRVESEKENAKLKTELKALKKKYKLSTHNHNAESDRLKSTIRELQQQVQDLQGALKSAQLEALKHRGSKKKKKSPAKKRHIPPHHSSPQHSPPKSHAISNISDEPSYSDNPLVNYDLARENELFRRYVTNDNCLASMIRDDLIQLVSQPRTPLVEMIFKSIFQFAISQDEYFEPEPPTLLHNMKEDARNMLIVNQRKLSGQREEIKYRNHILQILYRNNCSSYKYEDFGFEIVLYHNGHIRKSFRSGKKSYFYKEQGTLQMTYTSGVIMFTFESKNQHEIHFPNNLKRIQFEDSSIKWDH